MHSTVEGSAAVGCDVRSYRKWYVYVLLAFAICFTKHVVRYVNEYVYYFHVLFSLFAEISCMTALRVCILDMNSRLVLVGTFSSPGIGCFCLLPGLTY